MDDKYIHVNANRIPTIKMVACPICNGVGREVKPPLPGEKIPQIKHCVVCNGSGICRPNHWKKWDDWQIESMRKEWQEDTTDGQTK